MNRIKIIFLCVVGRASFSKRARIAGQGSAPFASKEARATTYRGVAQRGRWLRRTGASSRLNLVILIILLSGPKNAPAADPAYEEVKKEMYTRIWKFGFDHGEHLVNDYIMTALADYGQGLALED